ncbi:MAG: M20 family metallopeptidase [Pseudomonadota bacterium]|nr:M20 family metallopeptidase [Pseudomonadota bacterium]
MNKHIIWEYVEKLEPRFHALADQVWSTPETCYGEHLSMEAHYSELIHHGFKVKQGIAGIPTALIAEAGTKGPVIAFLGEYDALAGLSQQSDIFEEKPIKKNGNGHGCGHNLLGSAAMQAATSLKNWMTETGTEGIIRYYGCPAEEGGAAKTFMVREKAFEDVDIAITWHPSSLTGVVRGSSLANCRVDFMFEGRASHAAGAPHLGRSALDAIELMNVGVNYMREHMPDKARIHYAIIDGGGISPNVVQSKGRVRYVVRDENTPKMLKLLERVKKIARGAAMMTETKVKIKMLAGVSNLIYNKTLGEVMQRNLDLLGPPVFTNKERQYAKKMQSTMSYNDIETAYLQAGISEVKDQVLAESIVPPNAKEIGMSGSTDVADVSWVVPTVQLWGANYTIGTPFHSWQMTAQGKSSIAIKGMTHAATAMAATGVDVLLDKKLREDAWLDLQKLLDQNAYVSPLLDNAKPPIKDMAP